MKMNYSGNDIVQLGNGSSMHIKHLGSAPLCSSDSDASFRLHNLLHVPSINKNLISVSQFARDNNVFFEFYPNQCFVKNQATKEILLQGNICDGLHVFSSLHKSLLPYVNTSSHNSVMTPYELWHKRLGHASSRTVQSVM